MLTKHVRYTKKYAILNKKCVFTESESRAKQISPEASFFFRPGFFFFFFGTFKDIEMDKICVLKTFPSSVKTSGGTVIWTDVPGVRSCVLGFHGALHVPRFVTVTGSSPFIIWSILPFNSIEHYLHLQKSWEFNQYGPGGMQPKLLLIWQTNFHLSSNSFKGILP